METTAGLHALIKNKLIETNGNIKLADHPDIVLYGKALGLSENQLLFKVLEIEETIDWEKEKQNKILPTLQTKKTSVESTFSVAARSNLINILCNKCHSVNENAANYCTECGADFRLMANPETELQATAPAYIGDFQKQETVTQKIPWEPKKSSTLPIILGICTVLIIAGVVVYFMWGKDYLRDKNATRMYSFARSLALRSAPVRLSPTAEGNDNIIDNIPYGSELLVYDNGEEWVNCKFNGVEGYASPKYMLNKLDFHELNAILADEDTRAAVTQTRFKRALLNYFKDNNLIGNMDEAIQKELYGTITDKEIWQLFAHSDPKRSNTVFYSTRSTQNSSFNDFACILTNLNTGKRKIVMFGFDENENPKFLGETEAPDTGNISTIKYSYNYQTGAPVLMPIFTQL